MTTREQTINQARELESRNLFRRATEKWGEALSLSQNKKQEQECTKNNLRCIRQSKVIIREGW
ncbi:conserved hypothetical protein [Xenorhabdus innexi]|uniref:PerC family transcriptional regulator n=2 Tax=Xenorhabdus innexi TaxID=290109 RepID=A0A1N6N105_9GAMM|nr:hypothetical protein Xinn_02875 [Xenorhabdus innexi]SIP74781.1 conserved hypothetical protein [Xenorhabdus innexi]